MVLVPMALMFFKICRREPSPSATTETTEAMPMMMPSMVKKVRSRCAFMASRAMRKASPKRSRAACQRPLEADTVLSTAPVGAASGRVSRSDTTRPSLSSMMRSACAATCMSCVTMMMVWPSACSSNKILITSAPLCVSSAPVGSSARSTWPPFMSARAMLTRCCCPPES